MAFTLWLSAEEERILEGIMRHEGARTKQQAIISALRDKAAHLTVERGTPENPGAVHAALPGPARPVRA